MGTDKSVPFRLPIVTNGLVEDRSAGATATGSCATEDLSLEDLDAELARLDGEAQKVSTAKRVDTQHWFDPMVNPQFTKSERETTTLLVSGLTAAHDYLVKGALTGVGYKVEVIDMPDNEALRYGKEFGNRGQCNPTYFTVGNLVKFLTDRARIEGVSNQEIVKKYVFLT